MGRHDRRRGARAPRMRRTPPRMRRRRPRSDTERRPPRRAPSALMQRCAMLAREAAAGDSVREWTAQRPARVGRGLRLETLLLARELHADVVGLYLSLIHISEPTRLLSISYAVF